MQSAGAEESSQTCYECGYELDSTPRCSLCYFGGIEHASEETSQKRDDADDHITPTTIREWQSRRRAQGRDCDIEELARDIEDGTFRRFAR